MPQFPFLPSINFSRLRITFEAIETVSFFNEKGTAFRSCFMEAMMKAACEKSYKKCKYSCNQIYSCGYSLLLNSLSPVDHPHHGNFRNTPLPYIIEPLQDFQTLFKQGENFGFEITLIGAGIDQLPVALNAISLMGEKGIGKGRAKFKLLSIEYLSTNLKYQALTYGAIPDRISLKNMNIPNVTNRLKIQHDIKFRTKEANKHLSEAPEFQLFAKRLIDRLSLLAHFHCNAAWCDTKDMLISPEIKIINDETKEEFGKRKTQNMDAMMKLDGLVGTVTYEGNELYEWIPLIVMGSYLHVGSTTSMGLGKYKIIVE